MWELKKDLIDACILFVRSLLEYCAVVWHSRLTFEQQNCLERVQKCALRVILGEDYLGYSNALDACNLKTLFERREERCLSFAKRCLKHPVHQRLFPLNPYNPHYVRNSETFQVNFAKTETYKKSAIPYLQRLLKSE